MICFVDLSSLLRDLSRLRILYEERGKHIALRLLFAISYVIFT